MEGATVGSQEIVFRAPRTRSATRKSGSEPLLLIGDTRTAGSICLLLQAALPYALVGGDSIHWELKGGTNASMAPQYDYWELLFLPTLMRQLQLPMESVQPSVIRRGFFPKGGGEVHVDTKPVQGALLPISLIDRGNVVHVSIRSFYAGKCPRKVAERMASAAKEHLETHLDVPDISVNIVYEDPALASGSGILIIATTTTSCRLGGSALGSPKKSPIEVGVQAAQELCATLDDGGCVDEHLQDQLVLYMALAGGTSEMITGSMTLHTRTAIWTAEQCCEARFQIDRLDGNEEVKEDAEGRIVGRHRIRCRGIGFSLS